MARTGSLFSATAPRLLVNVVEQVEWFHAGVAVCVSRNGIGRKRAEESTMESSAGRVRFQQTCNVAQGEAS